MLYHCISDLEFVCAPKTKINTLFCIPKEHVVYVSQCGYSFVVCLPDSLNLSDAWWLRESPYCSCLQLFTPKFWARYRGPTNGNVLTGACMNPRLSSESPSQR